MRRLVKRLQGLLVLVVAGLEAVPVQWLAVATALNVYAQLWRTYASVVDIDSNSSAETSPPYLRSIGGDWLIGIVAAMSYTGLTLQLLLIPILAAQMALAVARQPQAPFKLKHAIESSSLLLVSAFTTIANHSGIIDITSAPLVADILLVLWKICAIASAASAFTVLPTYVIATMRQSRRWRQRRPGAVALDHHNDLEADTVDPYPWFLMLLPAIAASSAAGDLTMVLQPREASDVLIYSFVLWGAAIAPALVFTVSYIRHQVSRYSLLPPGSTSSPLDVLFPSAPVSQLALAIMSLGIQSRRVWADTVGPSTAPLLLGELAMAAGAILGLVLWAASAAWLINAHVLVIHKYRRRLSRREEQNVGGSNSIALILPVTTDTAAATLLYTAAPRRNRSAVAGCWQRINSLATCHAVYPLASFALATAYIARIWDSSTALHLTQLLLAYITTLMAAALARALYAAVQWVYSFAVTHFGRRRSAHSDMLQSPLVRSAAPSGDTGSVFDYSRRSIVIDTDTVASGATYGTV